MTRLLTTLTLATMLATAAMAAPAPDIPTEREPDVPEERAPEAPETDTCDPDDFKNQGQWVKCMTHSGIKGRELARRIHDEHARRKGVESTPEGKEAAKDKARRATKKAKKAKAKDKMKDKAKDKMKDKAKDRKDRAGKR